MKRIALWGAAAALAAAAPLSAHAQTPDPEPFLMVTGTGEARIPSDRGRIDFMVETQEPTAQAAAERNAERMERVVRAVRDAGGETVTVETGGYSLNPVYRRPARDESDIPVIEAYRAVNHVQVRADDVERVGALIDAAIAAGANRIASLRFEASDPEPGRVAALREAVARARSEAEAVAGAMGVALGAPLEVHTSADSGSPPMPMYRSEAISFDMAQAAPTPVEPGEQTVRASVTIKYALGAP